jgi:peptidoglycan-associated lipoprotein
MNAGFFTNKRKLDKEGTTMKRSLRNGLIMIVMLGLMMIFGGCAKEPVVKEEVTKPQKPAATKTVKPKADTGELATIAKAVPDEGTPSQTAGSERLGYFKVGDYIFYDVHFDFDKYALRPDDRDALTRHAKWFKDHPQYVVLIEGHCDEMGTEEYNLALGERRADAVRKYLVDLGVAAARIKTVSYGEEMPLDSSRTEEAFAKNRRAHFVVTLEK